MSFTAALIDELIHCEKQITDPPTRDFKEENRHRRKDMRLQKLNDAECLFSVFSVFIRQSSEFAEDFSFGLVYLSSEGKRMTLSAIMANMTSQTTHLTKQKSISNTTYTKRLVII